MASGDENERVDVREDGGEPCEEVGPEECGAEVARTEYVPGELHDPPEPGFDVGDMLHEQFQPEAHRMMIDPDDHMPRPIDPHGERPFAPAFTRENLCCIEDDRVFVELTGRAGVAAYDEITRRARWAAGRPLGPPPDAPVAVATPAPEYAADGSRRAARRWPKSHVKEFFGYPTVLVDGERIIVKPIRSKCIHYRRQLFNVDGKDPDEFGGKVQFQNCGARRSNGGALMSLSGQAVYGCDYRDPPDPRSTEKWLDYFDAKKLRDKPHLTLVPELGLPGEEVRLPDTEQTPDDEVVS